LGYVDAVNQVVALLGKQGEKKTTYRLRDWGISRQRYWGTPIPIIHCPDCGAVPVPEQDLPVVLPEDCVPDGSGNPLNKREDFLRCLCPKCGTPARRETDTMDTFIDSSWYFMRYCNPDSTTAMVDARNDYWMPMDQYIGGIEHAILHLLYARYWTKVMRDLGLLKFDEPFTKLLTQGMVIAETYYRDTPSGMKEWFNPADVEQHFDAAGKPSHAVLKSDGQPVVHGGTEKMAKSKNNGVDPQAIIDLYGADTARHFVMRASHPEQTLMWSDDSVAGSYRFVSKLYDFAWRIKDKVAQGRAHKPSNNEARRTLHLTLKKANADYERIQYNTVVSAGDIMLNTLTALKSDQDSANLHEGMSILLRVLYPVIPHVTHALWQDLGFAAEHGDLLNAPWPQVDETALAQESLTLPIQVNGKLRGELTFAASLSNAEVEALAKASDIVAKWGEGRPVKMAKYVPGRLITVAV
jgi:leucyl-tRNA synthetase